QEAVATLNQMPLTHPEERRLQKRLIKHQNWIFTFMAYPDVPADNKSSERAIKAAKIKDNVSGGFRSVPGASRFAQLLSPSPNPAKAETGHPGLVNSRERRRFRPSGKIEARSYQTRRRTLPDEFYRTLVDVAVIDQ